MFILKFNNYLGLSGSDQTIEEEIRVEQKRPYFFLHFSIWHLCPHIDAATCYEPY